MRIIDQGLDEQGRNIPIQKIAELFFEELNPKNKKGHFQKRSLIGRLKQKISEGNTLLPTVFYETILDENNNYAQLRRLVVSSIDELETKIIPETERILGRPIVPLFRKEVKEIISILGYKNVRNTHAQWLVDRLGIKTCPYCGIQYVLGVSRPKEKKVLCELDHFFPKDTYPYLCVSFYNLIPSCAFCNRLKSSSVTSLSTYPHPYHHNFDLLFNFKTDPQDVIKMIIKGKKTISIQTDFNTSSAPRIDKHFERFRLNEVYAHHSDIAEELYWKKCVYTKSRKDELVKLLGTSLELTKGEIERFIVGNYVEDKDMLRRPLAKLMRDIAKEVKLID